MSKSETFTLAEVQVMVTEAAAEGVRQGIAEMQATGAEVKVKTTTKTKTKATKSFLVIVGYSHDPKEWPKAMQKARTAGYNKAKAAGKAYLDWNNAGLKAAAKAVGAEIKKVKAKTTEEAYKKVNG